MQNATHTKLGGEFVWRGWLGLAAGWLVFALICRAAAAGDEGIAGEIGQEVTQGALRTIGPDGQLVECPLKHTDVQAEISGFVARVRVTQTFSNPLDRRIEATYVFPLPHQAAVDQMTMVLGDRRIEGQIRRRAEARQIYEQALAQGQTAALLEQERPNIFTQSVANIEPGQEVRVEISYVDVLRYDLGVYEFQFPMVVGPRYNPGSVIRPGEPLPDNLQGKVATPTPDTARVPDASRISPPVLKPGSRNGHDIMLSVRLDAGVPLQDLEVSNHQVAIKQDAPRLAQITLAPEDTIPNKDFVLRYTVVGPRPEMALLTHTGRHSADATRLGEGYFMLMVQPQEDERLRQMPPREIVFLVDVSGSMRGDKTALVIRTMSEMLRQCREQDTVQVVTFANQSHKLFPDPVPVNETNRRKALAFSETLQGSGGTEMLRGVQMAIDEPVDAERLRIVVMLTDGFIGNESEIIEHVGKKCGDRIRFWAIGIGSSPNMFLIDGVARQGGGMGKELGLNDDPVALSQEVMTRIQRAQLAEVSIDWGGLAVRETFPTRIPELWAGRPIVVFGRYGGSASAHEIRIRGTVEGEPVEWQLRADFPASATAHDVLANVWARQKIEDLMQQSFYQGSPAVEEEVTQLALDYRLMSPYTSFVAVDREQPIQDSVDSPVRMPVPIPLPEGAVWEGFFGDQDVLVESLQPLTVRAYYRARGGTMLSLERAAAQPTPWYAATAGKSALAQLGTSVAPSAPASTPVATFGRPLRRSGASSTAGGLPALRRSTSFGFGASPSSTSRGQLRLLGIPANGRGWANSLDGLSPVAGYQLVLPEAVQPLTNLLRQLQQDVVQLREAGRLAEAEAALSAWQLLQHFGVPLTESPGEDFPTAVDLRQQQVDRWREQLPALDRSISLELRDQSLQKAIQMLATAAGLELNLKDNTIDDAAELLNRDQLRISYLSVESRPVWETLDAILFPFRIQWVVDSASQVDLATARCLPYRSAWVYQVHDLAWPLETEFDTTDDDPARHDKVLRKLNEFLETVRQSAKPSEKDAIYLLATGELFVLGDSRLHQAVASCIQKLSDVDAETVPGVLRDLRPTVRKRLDERQTQIQARQQLLRWQRLAALHEKASWALLADAAVGNLNERALTELGIAWHDAETGSMLQDDRFALLLTRSLWTLQQSAAALPQSEPLAELVRHAREMSREMMGRTAEHLAKQPDEARLWTAMLTGLVEPEIVSPQTILKAAEVLSDSAAEMGSLGQAVAQTLLQSESSPALQQQVSITRTVPLLPETVVLTALACQRVGGDAWSTFRANSSDWLGNQPLPGEVIVLIHRLPGSTFH